MKTKHVKLVCFLLVTAIFLSLAASCANDTAKDRETPESSFVSVGNEEETTTANYLEQLPAEDFDAAEIRIVAYHTPDWANFWMEEVTGDVINDAVRQRDIIIEDHYNVKFVNIIADGGNINGMITKAVSSEDDAYDVGMTMMSAGVNTLAPGGYLYNLSDVPHLTLDSEWWNKSIHDNMSIDGVQYFTTGPFSRIYFMTPIAMMFNRQMITDYNLDNPYDLVREEKWTLEKMFSMMTGIEQDLNNDGKMDKNDKYGYCFDGTVVQAMYVGSGINAISVDGDGEYSLNVANSQTVDFVNKVRPVFSDRSRTYFDSKSDNSGAEIFRNGNSLFVDFTILGVMLMFREMEYDYGIIPFPKYDENQSQHYATCNTWLPNAVVIPKTSANAEMTGLILEAAAWQSYVTLTPAIYDTTLQGKLARDSDSEYMLDLIYANTSFDFNTVFDFGGSNWLIKEIVCGQKKGEFISSYESIRTKSENALDKFIEMCRSVEDGTK